MGKEKLMHIYKQAFLKYAEKSNNPIDKNIDTFESRKRLLTAIDIENKEIIKCIAPIYTGNWGANRSGFLVATNKRIFILFKKGLVGKDIHIFYYKNISSIDYQNTFFTPEITISTNGDKELTFSTHSPNVLGNLLRDFMEDSFNEFDHQLDTNKIYKNDNLEQIEKLFKLKESGAITEDEFITLKQQVITKQSTT